MNFGRDGYDPKEMLRFVIGVDSQFYPQIDALYRHRIEAWGTARRAEWRSDLAEGGQVGAAIPAEPQCRCR